MSFCAAMAAAICLSAAETPSPALLVLDKQGALAIVDPATGLVVAKVRTGDQPHEVAASSDGRLTFVSNYGGGTAPGRTLSVIDLVAQREIHRVDLEPLSRPHGLDFAGGKLYFTCEANKVVGRYDPAANRVDGILGTGQNTTHMVRLSPGLDRIYTANIGSDSISIFTRTGTADWSQSAVPVGKGPEGFDLTPDGRELWAANSRDGTVSVVNLAEKRVVRTFRVDTKRSNRLKFTHDGKLALISDLDGGELVIYERATLRQLKRLPLGRQPAGILVAPDNAHAYVSVTGDDYVAVIDLKTLELASRIQPGTGPDGLAWAVRP
jgi:YVTN family beta-propeller protein